MWTFFNNGHAKFHLIWDNVLVSANRVGGKAPTWDHRVFLANPPVELSNLFFTITAQFLARSLVSFCYQ